MKLKKDDEINFLSQIISLFSKIVSSVEKQSNHFNEIKKLINYIYQTDNWSILRLDETTNQLFFSVIEGKAGYLLKQIPIKVGEGICGQVALTGTYQILTDLDEKPDITQTIDDMTGFKTKSIIAVPIMNENKVMGVLELINVEDPEIFKIPIQLNLLQIIANLIGLIFSLSHTHQEIIHSSERDMLTGLRNRFWLNKFINKINPIYRRKKDENNILIIMIDLNNFKEVNDTYGHLVGDSLLKETAHLLIKNFREMDTIVRYGGDEFLVLIELQKHEKEVNIQESAQQKLIAISQSLPYSCSLSYGITYGENKDFYALLDEADKLMYVNKRQRT